MLKILLQLWWTQKRRTFDWKRMGIFIYMVLCVVVGLIVGHWQGGSNPFEAIRNDNLELIIVPLVVMFSPMELLMKFLLKTDAAGMDDYLRSKPVPQATWNRFLLVLNLLDYLNWFIPIMVFGLSCLLMSAGYALLAFGLSLTLNIADGLLITGLRKAQGWEYKLPLWLMLLFYYCLATPFMIFFMSWFGPFGSVVAWFFATLGFGATVYAYLCYVKHYNEQRGQQAKAGRIGGSSLFSMEYISLLRSKRLRTGYLTLVVVMTLQAYLQNRTMSDEIGESAMAGIFLLLAVMFSSMMLGQWIFGIEGNFFHGLMTKPVSVYGMLERKFLFFLLLDSITAVLLIPGIFLGYWTTMAWLSTLLLGAGSNVLLLPTCLFSKRIDLFSSAFFNYQGANMGVNVYGFVVLIPVAAYALLAIFIDNTLVVYAITAVLGLLLLGTSKRVLRLVAHKFMAKRYKRMEDFMK